MAKNKFMREKFAKKFHIGNFVMILYSRLAKVMDDNNYLQFLNHLKYYRSDSAQIKKETYAVMNLFLAIN